MPLSAAARKAKSRKKQELVALGKSEKEAEELAQQHIVDKGYLSGRGGSTPSIIPPVVINELNIQALEDVLVNILEHDGKPSERYLQFGLQLIQYKESKTAEVMADEEQEYAENILNVDNNPAAKSKSDD